MSKTVKNKKSMLMRCLRIILLLIALYFSLCILAILFVFNHEKPASTSIINLGDVTMVIPPGYIFMNFSLKIDNTKSKAIFLRAQLPDMLPKNEENRTKFEMPGWNEIAMIAIEFMSGDNIQSTSMITNRILSRPEIKISPSIIPGYTRIDEKQPSFFFHLYREDKNVLVSCDRDEDKKIDPRLITPSPACELQLTLKTLPGSYRKEDSSFYSIKISFAKKYAGNIEDIANKATILIQKFVEAKEP